MQVEELLVYGKAHCHSDLAKIILADILKKNPLELLTCLDLIVDKEKVKQYKSAVCLIEEGKPLQYAMGKVNFYGNEFVVDENVLIPRFETEELVENTIKYIEKFFTKPVDIIDLGCGSGVIGLTLEKKVSTKSVDLIDISEKALEVAHKNCAKLNSNAHLLKNDMLSNIEKKYDVIISNPPYIKTNEEIEEIVKNNEPPLALYAGIDGMDCYKKILSEITKNLKEKFIIAFEIGHTQKEDIIKLINQYLKDVTIEVKKDLQQRDRMCFIFSNNLF